VLTAVVAVALLSVGVGSVAVILAAAVFSIFVPLAVLALTLTMSVNCAEVAAASVAMLQVTVPVAPADGAVQEKVGPETCASDTKVVPAGTVSVSDTVVAAVPPTLFTVIV
jgi:hypothetical protein